MEMPILKPMPKLMLSNACLRWWSLARPSWQHYLFQLLIVCGKLFMNSFALKTVRYVYTFEIFEIFEIFCLRQSIMIFSTCVTYFY